MTFRPWKLQAAPNYYVLVTKLLLKSDVWKTKANCDKNL